MYSTNKNKVHAATRLKFLLLAGIGFICNNRTTDKTNNNHDDNIIGFNNK